MTIRYVMLLRIRADETSPPRLKRALAALATAVSAASSGTVRDDVVVVVGIIGGAVAVLVRSSLDVAFLEDLLDNVDILVGAEVVLELLLARVTHDALGALSCVEDLERVYDVGEWNCPVAIFPLLVDGSVCDDDLVEV